MKKTLSNIEIRIPIILKKHKHLPETGTIVPVISLFFSIRIEQYSFIVKKCFARLWLSMSSIIFFSNSSFNLVSALTNPLLTKQKTPIVPK